MKKRVLPALAVILALITSFGFSQAARSADLNEAVSQLATGDFAAKIAAVDRITASGSDQALNVLDALMQGRLVVVRSTGQVAIATAVGQVVQLHDAATGQALADVAPAEVDAVVINNRLRGVLRGALGSLTLLSDDAAKRREAADAVFRSRDVNLLPVLQKALNRETDGSVQARMQRAMAAIEATSGSETQSRLRAIAILAERPDPDVRSLLAGVADNDPDPVVKAAARAALDRVEERLALWGSVSGLFQGISLGSVLFLAAVGLAITFGVMGVINMAHGEMVMLGAYTTFVIQQIFRDHAPAALDWSLAIAIPAAFLVAGSVGILIERTIIRFLYGRPLETLLATWGLSLILQQAVRSIFGPSNREVSNPSWMSGALELTGGLTLTYNRIWIIVFSLLVFAVLVALINRSSFGLQMRAVTQNRPMAASMGIRTGRIDALTFGLGSGIAGIAGVALSQIDNVSPNLGQAYIIDSFMVVVFGGVGNLWGTLVGGFSLGIINKLVEPYAGAVLGKILVLVAIILFIQKRPRGLFALKGRAVEA